MSDNPNPPAEPVETPPAAEDAPQAEAVDAAAEAEAKKELPPPEVAVEQLGPCRRKVTLTASAELIGQYREEKYKEIADKAQVPGFRPGRAPRRLLVKRFGEGVDDEIKREIVVAGFDKAVTDNDLQIVGQPDMNIEELKVPEDGPMEFSFEAEVRPVFELPAYKGVPLTRRETEVTSDEIATQLEGLRKRVAYARNDFRVVQDGVAAGDLVSAAVVGALAEDGREFFNEPDRVMIVSPGMLILHPTRDEEQAMVGAKAGETRTVDGHVGARHEEVEIRGKDAKFAVTVKEVKRLRLPEVDDEFAKMVGAESVDDLKVRMQESAEQAKTDRAREAEREELRNWLVAHTTLDLPAEMTERQKADSLLRRKVRLLQQGVPEQVIQEQEDELKKSVDEQVVRDLKLHFIVSRIADAEKIEVGEEEINGIISAIAAQRGRRFARLREEMEQDGSLDLLAADVLERRVLDELVKQADFTAAPAPAPVASEGGEKA